MKKYQFLNKSIWIYKYPLHVIVITRHYCANRLNPDRIGAGLFFKQAPVFVVTLANPGLYKWLSNFLSVKCSRIIVLF